MRAENVQSGFAVPKAVTFSATLPNDTALESASFPVPLKTATDTLTPSQRHRKDARWRSALRVQSGAENLQ